MSEEYLYPQFETNTSAGLTKREYYASQAMAGMLASSDHYTSEHGIADDAVKVADELLASLSKEKTTDA